MSGHDHEPIDAALTAMEQTLQGLAPHPGALSRDRILFQAGAASSRPNRMRTTSGPWKALAASLALLAMGEGVLLSRRPVVVERVVVQAPPASAPLAVVREEPETPAVEPVAAVDPAPYSMSIPRTPAARLSWQIARYGLDGLPPSPAGMGGGVANGKGAGSGLIRAFELREALLRELEPGGPTS